MNALQSTTQVTGSAALLSDPFPITLVFILGKQKRLYIHVSLEEVRRTTLHVYNNHMRQTISNQKTRYIRNKKYSQGCLFQVVQKPGYNRCKESLQSTFCLGLLILGPLCQQCSCVSSPEIQRDPLFKPLILSSGIQICKHIFYIFLYLLSNNSNICINCVANSLFFVSLAMYVHFWNIKCEVKIQI